MAVKTERERVLYCFWQTTCCQSRQPLSLVACVDVDRHPATGSVSNCMKVRFTPPRDMPVELYIKVFVGYKNR